MITSMLFLIRFLRYSFLFILPFGFNFSYAQTEQIQSEKALISLIEKANSPEEKLEMIVDYERFYGNLSEDGQEIFYLGIELSKQISDSLQLSKLYRYKAFDYRKSNFEKCLDYNYKSLEISNALNNNLESAIVCNNLSELFFSHYQENKGLEYAQKALHFSTLANDTTEIVNAKKGISLFHRMNGRYEKALAIVNESIALCNSINECPESYGLKAFCQLKLGNRVEALRTYLQIQREYTLKSNDELASASIKHHIAYLLHTSKLYEQALNYYQEVLRYYKKTNYKPYLSIIHTNMGCVYLELNDVGKAEDHFIMAKEYGKSSGKGNEASYQFNMGSAALKGGNYGKAKEHFITAKNILGDRMANAKDLKSLNIGFAELYYALNHLEMAESFATDALEFYLDQNMLIELEEAFEILYLIHTKAKNEDRAKYYLVQKDSVSDLLYGPNQIYELTRELINFSNENNSETAEETAEAGYEFWVNQPLYWSFFILSLLLLTFTIVRWNAREFLLIGNNKNLKPSRSQKSKKSTLSSVEVNELSTRLNSLMHEKELYKNQDISIATLASEMHTTNKKLSVLLNTHLETTFYDYVNRLRVDDVKMRLMNGENILSIEGIAKDCGFKSRSSFYRTFKNQVGCTPSEFKKHNCP